MKPLRLVTRGSALALAQSNAAADLVRALGVEVEVVVVHTKGDRDQRSFGSLSGVGFFTKELQDALLRDEADLAVHSLKDLPTVEPPGLVLAAILAREDPRDAIVAARGVRFRDLAPGARVGTSSPRRRAFLLGIRRDLVFVELRGNVDTRIRKLESGEVEALVLAHAGLRRLGRADVATEVLEPAIMLPAPGQGAVAIETRAESEASRVVAALDHADTRAAVVAERAFLLGLGGGCSVPVGALGTIHAGVLRLEGACASPETGESVSATEEGSVADAADIGARLAARLREGPHASLLRRLLPVGTAETQQALGGVRVLLTASRETSAPLEERLRGLGADVVQCPAIAIEPLADTRALDDVVRRIGEAHRVVVTSRHGAAALAAALARVGASGPPPARLAAVGEATAKALRAAGLEAGLVASEATGDGLGRDLARELRAGDRVVLVRAEQAHAALPERLVEAGIQVTDVAGYRTTAPSGLGRALEDVAPAERLPDVVVFASPSAVRHVLAAAGPELAAGLAKGVILVACVGPTTAAELEALGVPVHVRAEAGALAEAIARVVGARRGR